MSRMSRTFGVAGICVGIVVVGVAMLLANDSATEKAANTNPKQGIEIEVRDVIRDEPQSGATAPGVADEARRRRELLLRTPGNPIFLGEENFDIFLRSGNAKDQQREALRKISENLKSEASILEKGDKKDDAARMRQTIQTLEAAAAPAAEVTRIAAQQPRSRLSLHVLDLRCAESDLERRRQALEQLVAQRNELQKENRVAEVEVIAREIQTRKKDLARKGARRVFIYPMVRDIGGADATSTSLDAPSAPEGPVKEETSDIRLNEVTEFGADSDESQNLRIKVGSGMRFGVGELMFGVGENGQLISSRHPSAADQAMREALGKKLENLKTEAGELEAAGKKDDAEQKRLVIRMMELMLQKAASRKENAASDIEIESKQRDLEAVKGDNEFADIAERFNELMDQKRFPEAAELAKKAIKLQPKNPVAEVMVFKAKRAAEDWFNQQEKEQQAAQIDQLKAATEKLDKAGRREEAAQKRWVIETLEAAVKRDSASKKADSSNYYQRDHLDYFPAGPEFKLSRQVEALEHHKARQQGRAVLDEASATALGKIIEHQKAEADELEKSGKKEDAAQKRQAIQMFEGALRGEPLKLERVYSLEAIRPGTQFSPEVVKGQLERRRMELEGLLIGRIAMTKDSPAIPKLEREIERRKTDISAMATEIEKSRADFLLQADELERAGKRGDAEVARKKAGSLAEILREHLSESAPGSELQDQSKLERLRQTEAAPDSQPDMTFTRIRINDPHAIYEAEMAARLGRIADSRDSAFIPGGGVVIERVARLRQLLYQWKALEDAAKALKQAGLNDNARAMSEASEKTRQEYSRVRHEAISTLTKNGGAILEHGSAPYPAAVPPDLNQTLTELRNQVQELRKDVGQLRELLEKKP